MNVVLRSKLSLPWMLIGLLNLQAAHSATLFHDNHPQKPRIELGAPPVHNYSPNDFHGDPRIWAVTQDLVGMMYFGNDNGIILYDGSRWQVVPTANHSRVRSLAVSAAGTVYTGSVGEFGYLVFDPTGRTRYVSLSKRLARNIEPFTDIWSIHPTSHGVYFVAKSHVFRWHENKLSTLACNNNLKGFSVGDRVVVLGLNGRFSFVDQGRVEASFIDARFSRNHAGRSVVLAHGSGGILVASEMIGLFHIDLTQKTKSGTDLDHPDSVQPILTPISSPLASFLNKNYIYCGIQLSDELYAIGTLRNGVAILHRDGRLMRIINTQSGLTSNMIFNLWLDKHKQLWTVTSRGIDRIDVFSSVSMFTKFQGLEEPPDVISRYNGVLYAASIQGPFMLDYEEDTTEYGRAFFRPLIGTNHQTQILFTFKGILFSASDNGIFIIQGDRIREVEGGRFDTVITYIGRSDSMPDHIIVGLRTAKYTLLKWEAHSKQTRKVSPDILPGKFVPLHAPKLDQITSPSNSVHFPHTVDQAGNLWISSETNGLFHVRLSPQNPKDLTVDHYTTADGLPHLDNCIAWSAHGRILISTRQGIYRTEELPGRTKPFGFVPETSFAERFYKNKTTVQAIYPYRQNQLLVVSHEGMGLLAMQSSQPGLENNWNPLPFKKIFGEFQNAWVEPTGVIWIFAGSALLRYDLASDSGDTNDFYTLIQRVNLNGKPIDFLRNPPGLDWRFDTKYTGSTRSNRIGQPLWEIPYGHHTISFEFAAPVYMDEQTNLFRTQLVGFDSGWSTWSPNAYKEYTNLPDGSYKLRVQAKSPRGDLGRKTSFTFRIKAPWFKSTWAVFGLVLITTGVFLLGWHVLSWRLRTAKRRLERIVTERTQQISEQKHKIELAHRDLQTSHQTLKETQQQLLQVSHQAGMAEIAINLLHNVGNALNSVNVSAGVLRETAAGIKTYRLKDIASIIRKESKPEHASSKGNRSEMAAEFLTLLGDTMEQSKTKIISEIDRVMSHLSKVNTIMTAQQRYATGPFFLENVSIDDIVKTAIEFVGLHDPEQDIQIRYASTSIPTLYTERHRLTQILINLLQNAKQAVLDHTATQKTINIHTKKIDLDRVQISVSDNGVGFSKELVKSMFNLGFTTKKNGHGFGLHFSANAAKEIGAVLTCESQGLGLGATFLLDLPIRLTPKKIL